MNFGEHFRIQQPSFSDECNAIVHNVSVRIAENIDSALIDVIVDIAKEAGVNDLIILDKNTISRALLNYCPAKPLQTDPETCPGCCNALHDSDNFCSVCGQRIDRNREVN